MTLADGTLSMPVLKVLGPSPGFHMPSWSMAPTGGVTVVIRPGNLPPALAAAGSGPGSAGAGSGSGAAGAGSGSPAPAAAASGESKVPMPSGAAAGSPLPRPGGDGIAIVNTSGRPHTVAFGGLEGGLAATLTARATGIQTPQRFAAGDPPLELAPGFDLHVVVGAVEAGALLLLLGEAEGAEPEPGAAPLAFTLEPPAGAGAGRAIRITPAGDQAVPAGIQLLGNVLVLGQNESQGSASGSVPSAMSAATVATSQCPPSQR